MKIEFISRQEYETFQLPPTESLTIMPDTAFKLDCTTGWIDPVSPKSREALREWVQTINSKVEQLLR